MVNIAGYLIQTIVPGRFSGEPGSHYNYITAGSGLYIRAENDHLQATIQIAPARVRGLADLQEKVELRHGRMPAHLFGDAMKLMGEDLSRELYVAVVWTGSRYMIDIPQEQVQHGAGVSYTRPPNTVLDLHSHPTFWGSFSATDDRDEVGFQVYGVIGMLHSLIPEYTFRIGVYGYFKELRLEEVFAL